MNSHLVLIAAVLMDKSGRIDGIFSCFSRQRNRPQNLSALALRRFYNLFGRRINNFVIVGLDSDSYPWFYLFFCFSHLIYFKNNKPAEKNYLMTFVTTPAPTVLPPSLIANRCCSSRATGAINLTENLTVSPGITISTPGAKTTSPVTSVVLI